MSARIGPCLKYPGAKWHLAGWIVGLLPPHRVYVEPYFGSGAVFFRKRRSPLETINDLDGDVVNLFRVLRDRPDEIAAAAAFTPYARAEQDDCWAVERVGEPVEDARRFLVRAWMNHGMRLQRKGGWAHTTGLAASEHGGGLANRALQWRQLPARIAATVERLHGVQIERRPALDILARYGHKDCLVYADPPYVRSTRAEAQYRHEMTDADHVALLEVLDAHPGPVLLSGYRCDLYDGRLTHWRRLERAAIAEGGRRRTEALWLNPVAVAALGRERQADLPGWSGAAAGG
jgi:DNA adenine methylase